jgi:hypothetical protein
MEKIPERRILSRDSIKSKQRVADHGEVFTPSWLVDAMLDLVKTEASRIDSRFLEPACGHGNFLVRVLQRKLATVEIRFGKSEFERRNFALAALMSIYGIELLKDNLLECRMKMLEVFESFLTIKTSDDFYRAASFVLSVNLVHGDSLEMREYNDKHITFPEWEYLGKGQFQRRDFRLDTLAQAARNINEQSWLSNCEKPAVLKPIAAYPPMTVKDLARAALGRAPRGSA